MKLGITALALFLVFRNIDVVHIKNILQQAAYPWLIPAVLLFVASKMVGAFRLLLFLRCIGISPAHEYNLKLYLKGMFYNLFLPGGIGGDAYKVFVLRKHYQHPVRELFAASLLDRISGIGALGMLFLLALLDSTTLQHLPIHPAWVWASLALSLPAYYLLLRVAFPRFLPVALQTSLLSLLIQLLQVFCILIILKSLHSMQALADYITFFLLSSIAAMLPFTIGGVGAREAVFVLLPQWVEAPIEQPVAVAMSLLFFLITAATSLPGAFLDIPLRQVSARSG